MNYSQAKIWIEIPNSKAVVSSHHPFGSAKPQSLFLL